jgi:hypothetical protein
MVKVPAKASMAEATSSNERMFPSPGYFSISGRGPLRTQRSVHPVRTLFKLALCRASSKNSDGQSACLLIGEPLCGSFPTIEV